MRVVKQIIYEVDAESEAFEKARKKLGPEAVVLSSVPVKRGGFLGLFKKRKYIVTAGILEDDEAQEKLEQGKRDRLIAFQKLLEGTSAASFDVALNKDSNNFSDVLELSNEAVALSHKPIEEKDRYNQKQSSETLALLGSDNIYEGLLQSGFDSLIAMEIVKEYANIKEDKPLYEFLADHTLVTGKDFISALGGKRAMFIGPTGVGKTTTIAKLAAIFALWHKRKVLLLGADTYRIAAVEQLRTYAGILEVPMEVVSNAGDVERALSNHDAEIVLADLPGGSQNDLLRLEEYRKVYEALRPDCVHLLIAANLSYPTMADVMEKLNVVPYNAIIFTKLDEAPSLGSLFRLIKTYKVPLSYITTGQDVPRDIEVALPLRLARLALGLETLRQTRV